MNELEHPILISVAEAVTDGMQVDWNELRRRNPELREDLDAMKTMAEVVSALLTAREDLSR